ncbi:MAG: alpha-L-arabinofuranosidase C-terminal domain-containing protein [Bacteroidaceae bacterium]|nr:alpha-L-arabinofuranosidase C-terminal domain-containing protein [Prevotellaceae bacterium]MDY5632656.1 alpha-L-arabinofuranosidase C-terminal domain-containing protein [Bacteroidaceae bacterium]
MRLKNLLLAAALSGASSVMAQDYTLKVKATKPGAPVQSTMYGIFFEDINFAADGGLYAELVKNRSFEFQPDALMGWKAFGKVTIQNDGPFERNPHYARLSSAGHGDWWTGLQNEGFFGIGLHEGAKYRFSVWARVPDGKEQKLRVQLIDQNTMEERQDFESKDLTISSREWKKYTLTLTSNRTIAKANLRLFLCDPNGRSGSGTVDVEHVSLFPVDTWMGHENGMRRDLAQALYDMKPGVFRFPGGCIVESATLETRYQWKNSVGPVENRPLNKNRWESTFTHRYYPDYFQTYGLGFFEYFQLSEELGAEPLPILNVGMACQYQNWNDESAHAPATEEGLREYIDDCIDLIEFANGPVDSKWGKVRAEMGHPAPFNLKFLGIGNEQWDDFYFKRVKIVADAVRKAHPEIKIVGTSGPDAEGGAFDRGWRAMKEQKVDLVDEHYYRPIDWFKNEWTRYDRYDRKGPKVFAGEYACHDRGKKWNHSGATIYEAAFMTGLERNADIVHMATYAPLFAHVEGWQWRPDAIWFDNLYSAKTTSYHVQALFSANRGTHVLPLENSNFPAKGEDGVLASAVWDQHKQEYIVKVANTLPEARSVSIVLQGVSRLGQTTATTLDLSRYDADNTPAQPTLITPVSHTLHPTGGVINLTVPGKNFMVIQARK